MPSYEWDAAKQSFTTVEDPILDVAGEENPIDAGYFCELSSEDEENSSGAVKLYMTDDPTKPLFYIDITGQNRGIATLVARDFPSLVETLRQVHPLLTLAGLDQFSTARIGDALDKKEQLRRG